MKYAIAGKTSRHLWVVIHLFIVFGVACLMMPVESRAGEVRSGALSNAGLYFPPAKGQWESVTAESLGWNPEKIEEAFTFAKKERSSGLVILHAGRMVKERYWIINGKASYARLSLKTLPGGRTVEDVASIQKSVVAFLMTMARERGLVDYDRPVSDYLGSGWSIALPEQEAVVTVRHLMSMSSGLNKHLTFYAPAGTKWHYNTSAYSLLTRILPKVTGKDLQTLTAEWLLSPTGMRETSWVDRPWAKRARRPANTVGLTTSARDMARFGILILAGGSWNGRPLLKDPALLQEMLSPSQKMNPNYAQLWWLNGTPTQSVHRPEMALPVPTAPADMIQARGALGRKIYIVPSLSLVVARLGDQPSGESWQRLFDRELWRLLMACIKGDS
jgi:CubicO group peptidase (beta-lactamase class C family)